MLNVVTIYRTSEIHHVLPLYEAHRLEYHYQTFCKVTNPGTRIRLNFFVTTIKERGRDYEIRVALCDSQGSDEWGRVKDISYPEKEPLYTQAETHEDAMRGHAAIVSYLQLLDLATVNTLRPCVDGVKCACCGSSYLPKTDPDQESSVHSPDNCWVCIPTQFWPVDSGD